MFYGGDSANYASSTNEGGAAGLGPGTRPAGPDVAALLAGMDVANLDEFDLVEAARTARAVSSWAASVELAAIAELTGRSGVAGEFAVDEVAAGLSLTLRAADRQVDLALSLARLPGTFAALAAGRIDVPKARVIASAAAVLDDEQASRLERAVLERAEKQTTGQLAAAAARAAIRIDPEAAARRQQAARRGRRVELNQDRDGTAALLGLALPPERAAAAYARIDAYARAAKTASGAGDTSGQADQAASGHAHAADGRGMDALRADALLDLLLGTALLNPDDLDNGDLDSGDLDGHDPSDGGDYGEDPAAAGGDPHAGPPATGVRTPAPLLPRPVSPSFRVGITVPLSTLLELSQEPGELGRYGPLLADIARQVAAQATRGGDRWCWSVTDETGRVIHHGRTAYRPTGALRDFLAARDVTCRAPGCRQPAAACDVDHTIPHRAGGPTCPCNCGLYCKRHHRMKHESRWRVIQPLPGIFVWTSPSGHVYVRGPGDDIEPPTPEPEPPEPEPPEPEPPPF